MTPESSSTLITHGDDTKLLELTGVWGEHTLTSVASVSKQFTAVGTMVCIEAGLFGLDTPVEDLVGYAFPGLSVRHLLHHTGGLRDYLHGNLRRDHEHSWDDLTKRLSTRGLKWEPGTEYEYGNSGYFLLGHIIERVTGQKFGDFMLEKVCRPCGMEGAAIPPAEIIPGLSEGTEVTLDHPSLIGTGDGFLLCTFTDLLEWHAALGGRLLKAESWHTLWTPNPLSGRDNYAMGWVVVNEWGPVIRHAGAYNGYSAMLVSDLGQDRCFIFLSNCEEAEPGQPYRRFLRTVQ